jgi:hypothetical protein
MNDMSNTPDTPLQRRLKAEVSGDVLFDAFSRGRYATDASIYQIIPVGAVVPETDGRRDPRRSAGPRGGRHRAAARRRHLAVRPDHQLIAGRSTARSTSTASSISTSPDGASCVVEPGIVLDDLNRQLKKHGLWYPVDVSTASRATIGGMAGNNSCGGRSLRYGTMRDNVFHGGGARRRQPPLHFGEVSRDPGAANDARPLTRDLLALGAREAAEIEPRAFPRSSAASAATISMRWCRAAPPTTWRISWWARRARSPSPRPST